jgi:hypothetical protein
MGLIYIPFYRTSLELSKTYPLVTTALVRAPQLQNAETLVQFLRQRIEVNSASSKRKSEKDSKS